VTDAVPPIRHDFPPAVKAIAAAGYRAYHSGRVFKPWCQLPGNEQFRWLYVADAYWRDEIEEPADLRSTYQVLINDVSWEDLPHKSRDRWQSVCRAMVVERALQQGNEKVVISG
jgi:hypothetical protein